MKPRESKTRGSKARESKTRESPAMEQPTSTFWQRLKQVGPALMLAAVVLGPGSLTLSTIAGSLYGYRLLWVPVAGTIFMITYTWMSARIGLVTGQTLFQATRSKHGHTLARIGGVFGFLSIAAFQAGNSAAIGFAARALFGGSVRLWTVLFVALAVGLVFLPDLYEKLERLVKGVVGVMIVTFVGTVVLVGVDVPAAVGGLVPRVPDTEAAFLALGMAATLFSIVAAVYQTYLVQEKDWGPEDLSDQGFESILGIGVLGTVAIVVLLTSAGAIYGTGDPVFSARGMASQLEPLVGPGAFYLFTIGFFFASLSSLVVNPLIGGTLLADGFGQEASMDGRPVKGWTTVALGIGMIVVLVFNGSPVELLRIAQGLAVVAFPVLGFLVLSLARDRALMGQYANATWVHGIAVMGYVALLGIAFNYARQILNSTL